MSTARLGRCAGRGVKIATSRVFAEIYLDAVYFGWYAAFGIAVFRHKKIPSRFFNLRGLYIN